jgi:hypothetical protein
MKILNEFRYKKDYDTAEKYFQQIELVPENEEFIKSYAYFLETIRKDSKAAADLTEKFTKTITELLPK